MPDRSWFFAAGGQQQGPYGEAQFRDLIAQGTITAETLVWTEGMAGWQKAGTVPGLVSRAGGPPSVPQPGGPLMRTDGGKTALSVDFGILDFTWRTILFVIGLILVIPAPWVIVWYLKWFTSCIHVPGRPNLAFEGRALTIAAWYFGAIVVIIILALISSASGSKALGNVSNLIQLVLYWLFLKWLIAHLASNGHPLGLSFSGSFWAYLGWTILAVLSFLTIIGWAWVYPAQIRWICRNIQGTRRQIVFKATGLQYLWRVIVTAIASAFIIPIPWVFRWLMQWQASQTELVEHGAYA
jgi:heme/copper-type cytochrome/quinol oxidase subunit 2